MKYLVPRAVLILGLLSISAAFCSEEDFSFDIEVENPLTKEELLPEIVGDFHIKVAGDAEKLAEFLAKMRLVKQEAFFMIKQLVLKKVDVSNLEDTKKVARRIYDAIEFVNDNNLPSYTWGLEAQVLAENHSLSLVNKEDGEKIIQILFLAEREGIDNELAFKISKQVPVGANLNDLSVQSLIDKIKKEQDQSSNPDPFDSPITKFKNHLARRWYLYAGGVAVVGVLTAGVVYYLVNKKKTAQESV